MYTQICSTDPEMQNQHSINQIVAAHAKGSQYNVQDDKEESQELKDIEDHAKSLLFL